MNEFHIPLFRLDKLKNEILKLNKICLKLKMPLIELSITNEEIIKKLTIITRTNFGNSEKSVDAIFTKVLINGLSPKIGDYSVSASIEEVNGDYQIFKFNESSPKIDTSAITCQHCKTNRKRKKYFQIQNEERSLIVGKSCLKDFIGHIKIESLISKLNILINNLNENRQRHNDVISYKEIIKESIIVCNYFGTKDINKTQLYDAISSIHNDDKKENDLTKKIIDYANKNKTMIDSEVSKIIYYFSSNKESVFENNIHLELSKELVAENKAKLGLIRYAPIAFYKINLTHNKKDSFKTKFQNSQYIGSVKDRITVELELIKSKEYFSNYGSGFFHYFKDTNNNVFIWSTQKEIKYDNLKLKCTIKKHKEYNGIKQTYITRCSILN